MDIKKYGTREWIESQYLASEDDPWGLNWRPSQKYRYMRMFDALKFVMASAPRPFAIVDVGCATGGFTSMLGELNAGAGGGILIGVDIAESAVARAVARFPQIRFECMALDECAVKYAGAADIVSCMEVLYYLPSEQRAQAVRQLKSMLKPGGCLLVSSMIASSPYFSFGELNALLADELNVVEAGVLYLKPFVLWEKFLMKLRGTAARRSATYGDARVERWSRYAGRIIPRFTGSHAYVIAQKNPGIRFAHACPDRLDLFPERR